MYKNTNELIQELMVFCHDLKFDLDLQQIQHDVKRLNFESLWIFMLLLFGDYYYLCSPLNNDEISWSFYRRLEDLHYKMILMNYSNLFDKNESKELICVFAGNVTNKGNVKKSFRLKLFIATESKKLVGKIILIGVNSVSCKIRLGIQKLTNILF